MFHWYVGWLVTGVLLPNSQDYFTHNGTVISWLEGDTGIPQENQTIFLTSRSVLIGLFTLYANVHIIIQKNRCSFVVTSYAFHLMMKCWSGVYFILGPSNWASLDAAYSACSSTSQSPVDITSASTDTSLGGFTLTGFDTTTGTHTVENTGHSRMYWINIKGYFLYCHR